MSVNTTNATFRQLLGNGLRYGVPPFQRDYSWADEKLGLPELQITEIGMRMRFVVPLQQSLTVQDTRKNLMREQVSAQVSAQVKALLLACQQGAKSKQELLEAAGFANAYLNYKRHIAPLLARGVLEMTLPDKPQSRLQKYRLTDTGRQLLDSTQQGKPTHE